MFARAAWKQAAFLLLAREAKRAKVCYTIGMKNGKQHWSVDETELNKDPRAYAIWRLEQRINFGVGKRKIKKSELKKYWDDIDIDPFKRKALALALE